LAEHPEALWAASLLLADKEDNMETKPGIYTTEFWITFALQVLLTLNTLDIWSFLPQRFLWVSLLSQAVLAGFYAVGRGIAKSGVGADPSIPANAKLVPKRRDMHPRSR
jgi:hypothetical protein